MFTKFVRSHRFLSIFLTLAVLCIVIMGTIYVTVQQNYRQGANDPQIEATEEIANAMEQGLGADSIINPDNSIDISKSLSMFLIIFDKDGKMLAGSGKLGDNVPIPPQGVIDYTKANGGDRFTWEPQKGTRVAAIIKKVGDDKGFVLAAKSLREVEKREQDTLKLVGIGLALCLLLSYKLAWILTKISGNIAVIEETNVIVEQPQVSAEQSSDSNPLI